MSTPEPTTATPSLVIGEPLPVSFTATSATPAVNADQPAKEPTQPADGNPQPFTAPAQPTPAHPQLGERGTLKVTSVNRGLVRKWLTSQGIPFSIAGNLPNGSLQTAYNDTSDGTLNALKAQAGKPAGSPAGSPAGQGEGTEGAEGTDGEGEGEGASKSEAQKAIETLAKSLGLPLGSADEATIRRIAREEAAKAKGREKRVTVISPLGVKPLGERTLHPLFERVCKAVSVGVNPLVFGPAGSGKTTLAEQVSEALGLTFYFSGAVLKKHELFGYTDANGRLVRTAFREAFEHGGLFLFDEVDASSASVLVTLNAALANRKCDFPDGLVKAHKDFRIIAAANTNGNGATREYCGRNQLDGASLDRFVPFTCDYDNALTERIVSGFDLSAEHLSLALEWCKRVVDYRKALTETAVRGILSPRAAIYGAQLIAAGFSFDELEESLIALKFSNAEERKRVIAKGRELTAARHAADAAKAAPAPAPAV
jgi:MoxR-like ATPase